MDKICFVFLNFFADELSDKLINFCNTPQFVVMAVALSSKQSLGGYRRDGVVVKASAWQSADLYSIPLSNHTEDLKNGIYSLLG